MGFYHSCQAIGGMLSNALQTAVHTTLDGKAGLAGWRWLFVINAIMTVVFSFFGFFLLPDLPNKPNPRAFWFNEGHAKMAMERLERHHRAEPKPMSVDGVKSVLDSQLLFRTPQLTLIQFSDARSVTG